MTVTSYAAIVINAAGITMRIYEMNKKMAVKQIDELKHTMNCGQEIYSEGRISFESADEICLVLQDFQRKIQEYAVGNLQLYISHSFTEAFNLDFLVTQIRLKTGMKAKVLNNSKEHYLTLQGIASKMPEFNSLIEKGTLILDVGYGNIQMTLYDHSELISTQTNRLGVARLREMVAGLEIRQNDYPRLINETIKSELDEYQRKIIQNTQIEHLIIVGGEMGFLNQVEQKESVAVYEREEIAQLSKQVPEVSEEHHRLLIPLLVMVNGFLQMTEASCVHAPDVHLCDGAASDFAYKKLKIFSGHHFTEDRISGAIHLANRFGCDIDHNLYVRKAAKELFKAVAKPYGLSNKDQQVLELASILHNCGRYVNLHYEDELSYAIVKESELVNLSDVNRILVANVLRYKNKTFPHARDLQEPLLSSDFYVILARITAIFRLAEALDDCHMQKLTDIHATIKNGEFVVRAASDQDVMIEAQSFEKSAGLFQEVFGLKPVFKCKRRI